MKTYKASEITKIIKGKLYGEDREVTGVNAISLAKENELIFVENLKKLKEAKASKSLVVLCEENLFSEAKEFLKGKTIVLVKNVRSAFAKVSELFKKEIDVSWGIHPQAIIEEGVFIEEPVAIYPWVYVKKGAKIKKRVVIFPGVFIGDNVEIGENTIIFPNVVIYPDTKIGKNCIIHAGVVIGSDGFGYAQEPKNQGFKNIKIYHFGSVEIGDNVEIGSNSAIDKALFGKTYIGEGTKIDNLVQIGHNVQIGKHSILVGQVGVSGSAVIGNYVMIGGQVGIAPHSEIGDFVKIAAKSGIVGKIPAFEEVAGIPAIKASIWKKSAVIFSKLPEIYKLFLKLLNKEK